MYSILRSFIVLGVVLAENSEIRKFTGTFPGRETAQSIFHQHFEQSFQFSVNHFIQRFVDRNNVGTFSWVAVVKASEAKQSPKLSLVERKTHFWSLFVLSVS